MNVLLPLAGLTVGILAALARRRRSAPRPPSRAAAAPPLDRPAQAPPGVYLTSPGDLIVPPFARLGSAEVTVEPLRSRAGGYARLTYAGALAAARAAGAELPTRADLVALSDAANVRGLELEPVTLPDPEQRAAGARPGDPAMRSRAWAERHDRAVVAQLAARGWNGTAPIANAGKIWLAGAAPGRARLGGWRRLSGTWIQEGTTDTHADTWSDYGTLTILLRRTSAPRA